MKNDNEFYTFRGYTMMKNKKRPLTASMEDYMEMIYRLCIKDGYVRINQLASMLNVQAPSATKTAQKLAELGLVSYEKYGVVQLTQKGNEVGEFLLERHKTIEAFLKNIGVKEMAFKDTEMIEHNISMETYECIKMLNLFLEANPDFIKSFEEFKKGY